MILIRILCLFLFYIINLVQNVCSITLIFLNLYLISIEPIEHLLNIYRTSIESLLNPHRTSIEHLSNIYRIKHLLKKLLNRYIYQIYLLDINRTAI